MTLDIVCFYRPRSPVAIEFATPKQYGKMLENLRQSAVKFGYNFHHLDGMRPAATCWLKVATWLEWSKQAVNPYVLIDPDCEIRRPLDGIFERDFDVALTKQNDPRHPYNAGVLFVKPNDRSQEFFDSIMKLANACSPNSQIWGCDQDALAYYMKEPGNMTKVIELDSKHDGNHFNWTPETKGRARSIPKDIYILHWRGRRKKWR